MTWETPQESSISLLCRFLSSQTLLKEQYLVPLSVLCSLVALFLVVLPASVQPLKRWGLFGAV
jgi:hypothetical protein